MVSTAELDTGAEIALRLRQQELAAEFSNFGLRTDELQPVLDEACRVAATGMECSLAKVLEFEPAECQSAFNLGSDSISVQVEIDEARTEKVELCTAVHLSLDELELGDLTFGLTVRPWFGQGGFDRFAVRGDAGRERGELALSSRADPGGEIPGRSRAQHGLEAPQQRAGDDQRWNILLDRGDDHRVGF